MKYGHQFMNKDKKCRTIINIHNDYTKEKSGKSHCLV